MSYANGQQRGDRILKEIVGHLAKEKEMRVFFLVKGKKLDYWFKQEKWDLPREGDRVSIYKQNFIVTSRSFDYDEAEIMIHLDKITIKNQDLLT